MTSEFNYETCPKCGHDRNSLTSKRCEICNQQLGKNKSLIPMIGAGLGALAIVGGAGYFLLKDQFSPIPSANVPSTQVAAGNPSGTVADTAAIPASTQAGQGSAASVGNAIAHLSRGEKILIADASNVDKQAGVAAIAAGDFSTAMTKLETARQSLRNDPETLIYLNNARLGANSSFTIAAVVPISGNPNAARELLRGVAQAQTEAVQSGVPFQVLIADDGNDPQQAMAIANALVQDNTVWAVIGHGTSRTSLAAAPIYQQGQLVMIAPTSTSTELAQLPRESGKNFIFRTIPSDQFTGTTLARYALSQGLSQALVFYNSQSSYSKSLMDALSTTLSLEGGQVVQQVDLSQGNSAAALTNSGAANVVVLLPDSETITEAIAVASANQNRLPMLAGDAFYTIDTLRQGGRALDGLILSVPWHPLKSSNPTFVQTGSALWGGDVNWRTALAYDAMTTLRTARSMGNITPQMGAQGRIILEQALSSAGFSASGTSGAITFLPSGDRNGQVVLIKVQPGTRSGTGFDFAPM